MKIFIYFATAFCLASLGYLFLFVLLHRPVFGGLYRMFTYHEEHPFQYIALVSVVYSFIASIWASTIGSRQNGLVRWITIFAIIPMTIIVASFPGGLLYSFHDMQAGFIPSYWFRKLLEDGWEGAKAGWLIVLLSYPFNLCGVIVGVLVTDFIEKKFRLSTSVTHNSSPSRMVQKLDRDKTDGGIDGGGSFR